MSLENIQKEIKTLARSGSLKLNKLMKPLVSRTDLNGHTKAKDADNPSSLPLLSAHHKKEKQHGGDPKGSAISSSGLMEYSSLLELLTCPACSQVVSIPVSQCRKGHLYCSSCRTSNSCRICKQTFSEAPNIALEKIITCIALPCKYSPHGCLTTVFQPSRLQHETVCLFRPVNCQFTHLGCQEVATLKDMCWHHKMCQYAHHPGVPYVPPKKAELLHQLAREECDLLTSSPSTNKKLGSQYQR